MSKITPLSYCKKNENGTTFCRILAFYVCGFLESGTSFLTFVIKSNICYERVTNKRELL